jgi:hypothetical protein
MHPDPHAQFDQALLDLIEHSPTGAVPHTPAHQDALGRLRAAHQVYPSADHKGGYVTVRSLAALPLFYAQNLEAFIAGTIEAEALEADAGIFSRYVHSLPAASKPRAEEFRALMVARRTHHRARHGAEAAREPAHTLFLVPGTGPQPGLPGNYLYGSAVQTASDREGPWALHVHDLEPGASTREFPSRAAALAALQDLLASAPFQLGELATLGFHSV